MPEPVLDKLDLAPGGRIKIAAMLDARIWRPIAKEVAAVPLDQLGNVGLGLVATRIAPRD